MNTEFETEAADDAELDLNADMLPAKLTPREKRDLQKAQLRPLANRRPEL